MTFPGGTIRKLGRGQITDDGEMTLALLDALANSKEYSINRVASSLGNWFNSAPFDVGNTVRKSVARGLNMG